MKVSGAMPINNEAEMLTYTLPHLTKAKINELVIVLDRCFDKSLDVIEFWERNFKPKFNIVKIQNVEYTPTTQIAKMFQKAFEHCSGDVIYSLAADCLYDNSIFNYDLDYDAICFSHLNWDLDTSKIRCSYEDILRKIRHFKQIGDVFAVKRGVWQDLGGFHMAEEKLWHPHGIEFFERLTKVGYKYAVKPSKTLHLRSYNTQFTDFRQGLLRAKLKESHLKVLLHSMLLMKPNVFKGYLHGK